MEIQVGILPQKGCVGIFMSTTSDFSLMINGLVSGFLFVKSYCSFYSQIGWGSCKFKSSHLILVDDLMIFFVVRFLYLVGIVLGSYYKFCGFLKVLC